MRKATFVFVVGATLAAGCGGKPVPTDGAVDEQPAATSPAAEPSSQAPTGFSADLELGGIRFQVSSPNAAVDNTVTVTPAGLEIDNSPVQSGVAGEVTDAQIADLDSDGSPEVYVFIRARDEAATGTVLAYAVNKRKSMSGISMPALADAPGITAGYAGKDTFAIENGFLLRRFPLVAGDGIDPDSVGRTRRLQYALMPGEATWLLQPVGGVIDEQRVEFAPGTSSVTVQGEIKGDETIDYIVNLAAGKTLHVSQAEQKPKSDFNVMPPGSAGNAMFVSDGAGAFSAMLPDDGDYVVRVYLKRPAARRNESAKYSLTIEAKGEPLPATPAASDALVAGTRYHAQAQVPCASADPSAGKACDVFVVRRGFDGTATLVLPARTGARTLLFVKGKPVASNAMDRDTLAFERKDDMTTVKLGDAERYEIPDALLTGG